MFQIIFMALAALASISFQTSIESRFEHVRSAMFNKALGVNCSHCHFEPSWSDSTKGQFKIARNMMRMVDALNDKLGDRGGIGCVTCHGGAVRPARQPGEAMDRQLARWPSELAQASETLKATMSVYSVALGVECTHCHAEGDWKSRSGAAIETVPLMNSLFEIFPKYMPKTARTQCYMCHKGSMTPVRGFDAPRWDGVPPA